jgi:Tfp pilus assembly protein FimT
MKVTKKLASILSVAAIATAMAVPTASAAAKGSLTFTHGEKSSQKITFARTTSTTLENSMDFTGWVRITAGEAPAGTYLLSSSPAYNLSEYERNFYAGESKGSSSFNYYVNGTLKHTSTAPWNFDFR